jgi:hypothetical protein
LLGKITALLARKANIAIRLAKISIDDHGRIDSPVVAFEYAVYQLIDCRAHQEDHLSKWPSI